LPARRCSVICACTCACASVYVFCVRVCKFEKTMMRCSLEVRPFLSRQFPCFRLSSRVPPLSHPSIDHLSVLSPLYLCPDFSVFRKGERGDWAIKTPPCFRLQTLPHCLHYCPFPFPTTLGRPTNNIQPHILRRQVPSSAWLPAAAAFRCCGMQLAAPKAKSDDSSRRARICCTVGGFRV
jgi:hypothetical protein